MCKHENHMLMGIADGIVCRGCGKMFSSFAEMEADRAPKAEQPKKKKKAEGK